jgi:hypothetical protein
LGKKAEEFVATSVREGSMGTSRVGRTRTRNAHTEASMTTGTHLPESGLFINWVGMWLRSRGHKSNQKDTKRSSIYFVFFILVLLKSY